MRKAGNDKTAVRNEDKLGQDEHGSVVTEEMAIIDSDASSTTASDTEVAKSTVAEPSESDREEDEELEEPYNVDNNSELGDDTKKSHQMLDIEGEGEGLDGAIEFLVQESGCTAECDGEREDAKADPGPDLRYLESQKHQHLEEQLIPNSSTPLELSNGESMELCSGPIFDEELYVKAGQPSTRIRGCRSPDRSRVVMMWKVYEDLDQVYPYQSSWNYPRVPEPSWPYTIAPIPGKGNGMLATRDIECGETILIERPLLLFPSQASSWDELQSDLEVMVNNLDPDDQKTVKSLWNSQPATQCEELTGLMFTNVMKCTFPQSTFATSYSGLCVDGCRANHSCSPNMVYEFNHEDILMEFRATRRIKQGEEICNSYIDPTQPLVDRQEHLQRVYGFRCACSACTLPTDVVQSDERREKIKNECFAAPGRWRKWLEVSLPATKNLIEEYKELLSKVEKESLYAYRPVPIRWLAYTYAALGDEKEFKKWCREAVACFGVLCASGKGFLDTEVWKGWLVDPSSVPFWGIRKGNKWA